jgi:hypothetical protein
MQKERHIVLRACRVGFDFLKEKGCHEEGKGKMRKKNGKVILVCGPLVRFLPHRPSCGSLAEV